jgi:hypothetical protein
MSKQNAVLRHAAMQVWQRVPSVLAFTVVEFIAVLQSVVSDFCLWVVQISYGYIQLYPFCICFKNVWSL